MDCPSPKRIKTSHNDLEAIFTTIQELRKIVKDISITIKDMQETLDLYLD